MSKIICDICGTTYPDTAECCPICGCSADMAAEFAKEDISFDTVTPRPTPRKKEIFDFDEVNGLGSNEDETEDVYAYSEEEEEQVEESQHNTFLVVVLTVLIVVLLALTGFLFFKFFLPNVPTGETEPATAPVETTLAPTTVVTETTELRIPCQSLALSSGNAELTHEGMQFLLNVVITPEDTTDSCTYVSEDESVATVEATGRITAVAEGETVVTVICGEQTISCPVICKFVDDNGETVPETEETTEATTVATVDPSITLKLKKTDIMLPVFTYFTLQLDCDLEQTDVQWTSAHPYIATVDENGVVTAMKAGTTEITAKYGDQEVKCIVRCY